MIQLPTGVWMPFQYSDPNTTTTRAAMMPTIIRYSVGV
jgi:hypothetical protein